MEDKQITSANNSLNESYKALQEAIRGLENVKQNLLDASTKQREETETLQISNKKLTKDNQELLDKINVEENKNQKLANKIEELEDKYEQEQNLNKELRRTKEQTLQKNSALRKEITGKDEEIHDLTHQNDKQADKIKRLHKLIESLQQETNTLRGYLNAEVLENAVPHNNIHNLKDVNSALEEEKEDALRKLNEQVSKKRRDDNPNIVDLSDQCRPTKLAEMFSELYDNEWTNAFSVLEDTFTEEQAIVVLLDTIMLAYGFCEERVNVPWQILTDWFLDEDLPGAQQTTKWLKDSRKTNIQKHVPLADKNFSEKVRSVCNDEVLMALLSDKDINVYFTKCIELCLLMVATDPPVVLVCPGWEFTHTPEIKDATTNETTSTEEKVSNNVESNTCLPAQQSQTDDDNQQTKGMKEEPSSFVVETVYDGTDTDGALSIDDARLKDIEKHQPSEADFSDESSSTSHDNIDDSGVVNPSPSVEQMTEHQEKDEHESIICDNENMDSDELTVIQQQEYLKGQTTMSDDEDDDNDETIFNTKGANKKALPQLGLQESPDDMESIQDIEQDKGLPMQETENMNKNDHIVQPQFPAEKQEQDDNGNGISGTTKDEGGDSVQSNHHETSQRTDFEVKNQDENTNSHIRTVDEVTEDEAKPKEKQEEEMVNSKIGTSLETTGEEVPLNSENGAVAKEVNDKKGESCTTDLRHRHNESSVDTNECMKQALPIKKERLLFDKELFTEYTRRGKYLDYIIWPALCLHKDGALLSKGVAQGSKDKCREQNDAVWTWRS